MNQWHDTIQNELDSRNAQCKQNGILSEYILPKIDNEHINPFIFPNVDLLNKIYPFDLHHDCKLPTENVASYKNELENAFIRATNQNTCTKKGGVWSPNSYRRGDGGYTKGVCWVDDKDAMCGNAINSTTVFRPYEMREFGAFSKIEDAKKQCPQEQCKFVQTGKFSYDCLAKERNLKEIELKVAPLTTTENRCKLCAKPIDKTKTELTNFMQKLDKPTVETLNAHIEKLLDEPKENEKLPLSQGQYSVYKFLKQHFPIDEIAPRATDVTPRSCGSNVFGPTGSGSGSGSVSGRPTGSVSGRPTGSVSGRPSGSVSGPTGSVSVKRGIVIWHSTGSGKTCLATGIMSHYWRGPRDIYYISSIEALKSNPPETFAECAVKYWPGFASVGDFLKITSRRKTPRVQFLTFAVFAHLVQSEKKKLNLNNCVLIFDEMQNLFMPLATQRKEHDFLRKELANFEKWPQLKVFILSATPGTSVNQVLQLLNFVRDVGSEPIVKPAETPEAEKAFVNQIKNLVSYFDMSYDYSAFPKIINADLTEVPMSAKQYKIYEEKFQSVLPYQKDYNKLLRDNSINTYWAPARKYSNSQFNLVQGQTIAEYSAKLPHLIENILKYPKEKHFVYSSFYEKKGYGGHGIRAVALQLEKAKYTEFSGKGKGKHYILAISPENDAEFSAHVAKFNSKENSHGELIHVFLASKKYNEGLDLKDVRHIHVFEPLVTWAADRQLIGRAVRYCSHANLDKDTEWTVTLHRYITTRPKTDTLKRTIMIEEQIYAEAQDKAKSFLRILNLVKQSAIDCNKFASYHHIKCQN